MAVMLFVGSYFIWDHNNDKELKVYVSFMEYPYLVEGLGKVAFASVVTTCGVGLEHVGGDVNLYESFVKANSNLAKPRSLSKLTTHANVVSHSIAEQHHAGKISGIASKYGIVNMSRVGFNTKQNRAAFCYKTSHSTNVAIAVRGPSGYWRTKIVKSIWVQ